MWLYTHIQSADLRSLDEVASGQLVTRSITDLQLIEQLLRLFPTLIGFTPLIIAVAILVIILNPLIGILAILALPVNLLLLRLFSRRLRALSWAELNERAEVTRTIDEPVRGIRVVKAFGRRGRDRGGREGHRHAPTVLDDAGSAAGQVRRRHEAGAAHRERRVLAFGAWRLSVGP